MCIWRWMGELVSGFASGSLTSFDPDEAKAVASCYCLQLCLSTFHLKAVAGFCESIGLWGRKTNRNRPNTFRLLHHGAIFLRQRWLLPPSPQSISICALLLLKNERTYYYFGIYIYLISFMGWHIYFCQRQYILFPPRLQHKFFIQPHFGRWVICYDDSFRWKLNNIHAIWEVIKTRYLDSWQANF